MADSANPIAAAKETTAAKPEPTTRAQPANLEDGAHEPRTDVKNVSRKGPSEEPAPPTKPPRPLSPQAQAEKTLREAFPSIDAAVIRAVLSASGGNVEPAFDALLGMTDPESQNDAAPPAKPPRPPQQGGKPTSTAQSQLEADEMYARQLHEHYSSAGRQPRQNQVPNQQAPRQRRQEEEEREYSFLDDDLPMIRDNIRKGFLETQSTVNKWVTNFKKKLDGDDDESFNNQPARPAQGFQAGKQGYPSYGRKSSEITRRSADRERYDADPQVLGDDFSTLELRDPDGAPPKKPQRPLANPDLFKPSPPGSASKVSFQDGPPEEIDDMYSGSSTVSKPRGPASKSSKWQPLSAVEPSPVAENDPFSLGDSDDEIEIRAKDSKSDEVARLNTATAEIPAGSLGAHGKDQDATESEPNTKT